ncbi:DUF6804 family protein [Maribacter dokdonensis]|nr:DUF6804 family protein [Maribacter dokdonensis]
MVDFNKTKIIQIDFARLRNTVKDIFQIVIGLNYPNQNQKRMNYTFKKDFYSYLSITCAIVLLIAIFPFDSFYYKFLRVFVFLGALVMAYHSYKTPFRLLTFVLIAYLFNPIFPIYLFQKLIWVPVDIISGLLFLMATVQIKKKKPFIPYSRKKSAKSYGRDRKF